MWKNAWFNKKTELGLHGGISSPTVGEVGSWCCILLTQVHLAGWHYCL